MSLLLAPFCLKWHGYYFTQAEFLYVYFLDSGRERAFGTPQLSMTFNNCHLPASFSLSILSHSACPTPKSTWTGKEDQGHSCPSWQLPH